MNSDSRDPRGGGDLTVPASDGGDTLVVDYTDADVEFSRLPGADSSDADGGSGRSTLRRAGNSSRPGDTVLVSRISDLNVDTIERALKPNPRPTNGAVDTGPVVGVAVTESRGEPTAEPHLLSVSAPRRTGSTSASSNSLTGSSRFVGSSTDSGAGRPGTGGLLTSLTVGLGRTHDRDEHDDDAELEYSSLDDPTSVLNLNDRIPNPKKLSSADQHSSADMYAVHSTQNRSPYETRDGNENGGGFLSPQFKSDDEHSSSDEDFPKGGSGNAYPKTQQQQQQRETVQFVAPPPTSVSVSARSNANRNMIFADEHAAENGDDGDGDETGNGRGDGNEGDDGAEKDDDDGAGQAPGFQRTASHAALFPDPFQDKTFQHGEVIHSMTGHTAWVSSVSMNSDQSKILSGGGDGTFRLWDVKTGICLRVVKKHKRLVRSAVFLSDPTMFSTAGMDGNIYVWKWNTSGKIQKVYSFRKKTLIRRSGHSGGVAHLCAHPREPRLGSGSGDYSVKVWDYEVGKLVRTFTGHQDWVNEVQFSPDGKTIASASRDDLTCLWDLNSGECVRTFSGHTGDVRSVIFSATDDSIMITGSYDRTIRVWNIRSGQTMRVFTGHTNDVLSLAYLADEEVLLSGSRDKTIKVWDMYSQAPSPCLETWSQHTEAVTNLCTSVNQRYIVSGSRDLSVKLWAVE